MSDDVLRHIISCKCLFEINLVNNQRFCNKSQVQMR